MKSKILIIVLLIGSLFLTGCINDDNVLFEDTISGKEKICRGQVEGSKDLYYRFEWGWCHTYNKTAETIKKQNKIDCFNNGSWENQTFDLIKDYNLTCGKIEYINDHLIKISTKKKSGYISGISSGFLSYGSINGEFNAWVEESVLATGMLPQSTGYHLDCKNSTATLKSVSSCGSGEKYNCKDLINWHVDSKYINHYTESDLVIYYVDNCIGIEQ